MGTLLRIPNGNNLPFLAQQDMLRFGYNPTNTESVTLYFKEIFGIEEGIPRAQQTLRDTIARLGSKLRGGLEPTL